MRMSRGSFNKKGPSNQIHLQVGYARFCTCPKDSKRQTVVITAHFLLMVYGRASNRRLFGKSFCYTHFFSEMIDIVLLFIFSRFEGTILDIRVFTYLCSIIEINTTKSKFPPLDNSLSFLNRNRW